LLSGGKRGEKRGRFVTSGEWKGSSSEYEQGPDPPAKKGGLPHQRESGAPPDGAPTRRGSLSFLAKESHKDEKGSHVPAT